MLFSLQWLHNADPPDLELVMLQDASLWFDWVSLTLLSGLRDRLRASAAPLPRVSRHV